jgi:hypothetical protein
MISDYPNDVLAVISDNTNHLSVLAVFLIIQTMQTLAMMYVDLNYVSDTLDLYCSKLCNY